MHRFCDKEQLKSQNQSNLFVFDESKNVHPLVWWSDKSIKVIIVNRDDMITLIHK